MKTILSVVSVWLGLSASLVRAADAKPYSFAFFFGDSYTDDSRSTYWFFNNHTLPPPGVKPTEVTRTYSGGLTYPQYIEQTLGSAVTVGDYAFSGSGCSTSVVPLNAGTFGEGSAMADNLIPEFISDAQVNMYPGLTGDNAVYSIWIGTNDIGLNGFLLDKQVAGKTISDEVECIFGAMDKIYNAGGRRFILMNQNILDYSPLYQTPEKGGTVTDIYWADKNKYDNNAINAKMAGIVSDMNQQCHDGLANTGAQRWPGADLALFDVHQLMLDLYNSPDQYLTAPANATWFFNDGCNSACPDGRLLDSYLWNDSLHPSNKTDTYIAKEWIGVVDKTSAYGVYF